MTIHTRVSGNWVDVDEIHAKVSGSWEPVQEVFTRISGAWRRIHGFWAGELTIGQSGVWRGYSVPLAVGNLSQNGFLTDSGVSKTIQGIGWSEFDENTRFLVTTSTANDDDVFTRIVLNSVEYLRSAATYTSPNIWSWADTAPIGTSGVVPFEIHWD